MNSDKKSIVITSAARTAIGTFNGSLKNMQGHDLGSIVVKEAMKKFKIANIPIIRVGLHADPSMLENFVAGPYHPSFRYLVDSLIARDEMTALIEQLNFIPSVITFKVPSREVSLYLGHKNDNIQALRKQFGIKKIIFQQTGNHEVLQLGA